MIPLPYSNFMGKDCYAMAQGKEEIGKMLVKCCLLELNVYVAQPIVIKVQSQI